TEQYLIMTIIVIRHRRYSDLQYEFTKKRKHLECIQQIASSSLTSTIPRKAFIVS
ncbi:hypothetical protein L9F63_005039, partial [Diploptera punctata]